MIEIITAAGKLLAFTSAVAAAVVAIHKLFEGERCLLRSEMLRIYYKNADAQEIRQYELENFCMLYGAYKRLHGNSFIDKVSEDVKKWRVIS